MQHLLTIHQPRQEVFRKVDRVMVLKNGKQVFYGARKDCENFISAHYIETKIPSFSTTSTNTADTIMDLISNQKELPEVADFRGRLSHDVEMCMRMLREHSESIVVSELKQKKEDCSFSTWWDRVRFQSWRAQHASSKMDVVPFIAMFLGSTSVAMCFTGDPGPIHYAVLLFLMLGLPPYFLNRVVVNKVYWGNRTLSHESQDGCCSVSEYLAQHVIANACFSTGAAAISTGIQFSIGLKKLHSLSNFIIVMTLTIVHTQICTAAFTTFGIVKNGDCSSAITMGAALHTTWQLLAGFIMPLTVVPTTTHQLKWLSVTVYAYGSMILSLFDNLHFDCVPGKSQLLCLERKGASITNYLNIQDINLSSSVAMLWVIWFGLYAASMLILASPWKTHKLMHIKHHASSIPGHFNLSLMSKHCENRSRIKSPRSLSPSPRKHNTGKLESKSNRCSPPRKYVPNLQIEVPHDKETKEHDNLSWEGFETSSFGSSPSFKSPPSLLSTGYLSSPLSPVTPRETAMKNFMDCGVWPEFTEPEVRTEFRRRPNNTRRMSTGIKKNAEMALKLISHVFCSNQETECHCVDGG